MRLLESTAGRGIYVQRQGDRVQLSTTPEAAPYIEHFLEVDHGHLSGHEPAMQLGLVAFLGVA